MSTGTALTGSGVYTPAHTITNEELCDAFNAWVRAENDRNAAAIEAGDAAALAESSPDFIVKASGIERRYVHDRTGILDPERLCPNVPYRDEDQLSVQAEYAVEAGRRALEAAGRVGEDVDLIILGASSLQRMYPSIAIEVQAALGARGFAYDIAVGCSSLTTAIKLATEAIMASSARCALVVGPEMTTGHMNWRDRDSHFIFGDAGVAVVVEPLDRAGDGAWEILSTRTLSRFSSNIRNNAGYLNRCDRDYWDHPTNLFHQKGRRVFKDVVPLASRYIADHVASHGLESAAISRYWLHQANKNMNDLIAKRLYGRPATESEAPLVLAEYGNTASAGSLIAFSLHNGDLRPGSYGVMCSFGAGYSIGSLVMRRL